MIPGRRHRRVPIDYDRVLYRERNIVERSIGWLKQDRRIATRYEKTAASYLGFVLFAAARQWLRNPLANVHTPYTSALPTGRPRVRAKTPLKRMPDPERNPRTGTAHRLRPQIVFKP